MMSLAKRRRRGDDSGNGTESESEVEIVFDSADPDPVDPPSLSHQHPPEMFNKNRAGTSNRNNNIGKALSLLPSLDGFLESPMATLATIATATELQEASEAQTHDDPVTTIKPDDQSVDEAEFWAGDSEPDVWRKAFEESVRLKSNSVTFLHLCSRMVAQMSINELRRLIFHEMPVLTTFYIELSNVDHNHNHSAALECQNGSRLVAPLPNLRRIKVISPQHDPSSSLVQFVSDVITSTQNLDYIAAKLGSKGQDLIVTGILSTISEPSFGLGIRISRLKTLTITVWSGAELEILTILSLAGGNALRLEELSISVVCNVRSTATEERKLTNYFDTFLRSQAQTLRKLRLEFTYVTDLGKCSSRHPHPIPKYGSPFCIPHMAELVTFKLTRSEDMQIDLTFEGLNRGINAINTSNTLCTRLKRLGYYQSSDHSSYNFHRDLELLYHHKMPELNLTLTSGSLNYFRSRYSSFVTQLTVTTTYWNMTQVWYNFPSLTKLHMCVLDKDRCRYSWMTLDQLLSQVCPTDVADPQGGFHPLTANLRELRALAENNRVDRPYIMPGSISSLRDLEDFTLEVKNWPSEKIGLTNVGVYLGLALGGPKLKRITVQGHGLKNNVSDKARAFLQNVLGSDAVINIV